MEFDKTKGAPQAAGQKTHGQASFGTGGYGQSGYGQASYGQQGGYMQAGYGQGAPAQAPAAPAAPAGAGDVIKDTTTQGFRQDVIAESMKQPVLVDFWAPWCGPCKQLTPVIEKVVKAAGGKVKLVKLNIDEHPQIPGQLGIQSIPAIIAFTKGQPVDGFMGNLPESQVKTFIERLVGPMGPTPVEEILTEAAALAQVGDVTGAAELYGELLMQDPGNVAALGALAEIQVGLGDIEAARNVLAMAPAGKVNDPALAKARAAIEIAEQASALGEVQELMNRVEANPADHQARFDLALALNAKGQRDEAIDQLVAIVRRDRTWNEDGARKQIVQFFEAWGPMDEATIAGRRKLSAVLFA
jgi:putative thioredoxin